MLGYALRANPTYDVDCLGETAMPNTVRLHRVLATKPDKVYRAFIEADAMAKWLPPNGFTCTVHHLDAKVGGTFRNVSMTLRQPGVEFKLGCLGSSAGPHSSVKYNKATCTTWQSLAEENVGLNRDRGTPHGAAPPTPPGIRVRTTAVRRIKRSPAFP
jgi:hypothetical protein